MMRVSWGIGKARQEGIVAQFVTESGSVFAVVVTGTELHLVNIYNLVFEGWRV